jgi:hypothetical protein
LFSGKRRSGRWRFGLGENADGEMSGKPDGAEQQDDAEKEFRRDGGSPRERRLNRSNVEGGSHESEHRAESHRHDQNRGEDGGEDHFHGFMGAGIRGSNALEARIAQANGKQNGGRRRSSKRSSAQPRPIVGNQNGVAGICRVRLDAGWLAGNEALEANLAFEAGNVLRGVIGNTGDGVTVRHKMPRSRIWDWTGSRTKYAFARCLGFRRMLGELHDLALGDAADLIEMEAPFALDVFRGLRRPEESVSDHGQSRDRRATHRNDEFPIREKRFQRRDSTGCAEWECDTTARNAEIFCRPRVLTILMPLP